MRAWCALPHVRIHTVGQRKLQCCIVLLLLVVGVHTAARAPVCAKVCTTVMHAVHDATVCTSCHWSTGVCVCAGAGVLHIAVVIHS